MSQEHARFCLTPIVVAFLFALLCSPRLSLADPLSVTDETAQSRLERLEHDVAEQKRKLAAEERALADQTARLARQQEILEQQYQEILFLRKQLAESREGAPAKVLPSVAGSGPPASQIPTQPEIRAQEGSSGDRTETAREPVGEPPPREQRLERPPEVQAIAEQGGVLLPRGTLSVEPSVGYSTSSISRFTFRGVSVVEAVLIGVIDATEADRELISAAITTRYGLTNRLELEATVPYVYRNDSLTTFIRRSSGDLTLTNEATGYGLGDVEIAAHYQINGGLGGWPFFVGNLRYKSTTGKGPFDVERNAAGVETELPTGSGFHAVGASLTAIYPTDPAVLFANIGYVWALAHNVNKDVGDNRIGKVDPGNWVETNVGVSLAVNERLSLTAGYKHLFIQKSTTEIDGQTFSSSSLDVGSLLLAGYFRLSDRVGVNLSVDIGVTPAAPDVRLMLRVPVRLN